MGRKNRKIGALTTAIAAELRAERVRQKMTLEELSEESGIAYSTLGKLLNGQSTIDTDQLAQVADAFGLSMREILLRAERDILLRVPNSIVLDVKPPQD